MDRLEPADREILTFRLQGEELEAIARQLNCSERTLAEDPINGNAEASVP
jgi:DNA-binding NarL/FixJ family response regulator